MKEDNFTHNDSNFIYFDEDDDDMDSKERYILKKMRKYNIKQELIEDLAKDLKVDIEVSYTILKLIKVSC